MNFRTRVDFTNRQAKQYEKTNINLSGGTVFGLPYSALTSGPDLTLTGITFSNAVLQSTYSGNTGTTVYTFGDSRMSIDEGDLSALTPSNSATTQYAGPTWIGYDIFTTIDGYTGWTSYSAVTYDLDVVTMVDLGGGAYSGVVESNFIVYSATSLDYTGSTIWVDVSGITRTDELIVTKNSEIGYVLTCMDVDGRANWLPVSGATSGSSLYEIGVGSNSTQRISVGNSTGGNFSATLGGSGNTTSVGAQYATIVGGRNNSLTGAYNFIGGGEDNGNTTINWSSIVGGRGNSQKGEYSFIGGGRDNSIESFPSNYSTILGGRDNLVEGDNIHIIGSNITGSTDNTTYVNSLNIGTLASGLATSVLLSDINGNVISASTMGITFWEETGASNTALKDNKGSHTITGISTNSIIAGGSGNTVNSSVFSGMFAGLGSILEGTTSTIVGGWGHTLGPIATTDSVILGGISNVINGSGGYGNRNGIVGGQNHLIDGRVANNFLGGGSGHTITGERLAVVGGTGHAIGNNDSFIGGGRFNQSMGNFSVILGGERNTNNSTNTSIISSTDSSIISQHKTTIIGSDTSIISGISTDQSVNSIILGGKNNLIDKSTYSAIIGGTGHTVTSGTANSIILGGSAITADTSDMVYVPNLTVVDITTGTSVSSLGIDATGKLISVTKEVYYSALGLNNGTLGRYYGYTCNGGTDPVYVNGKWPSDFNNVISIEAIVIPTFSATESTFLVCQYGKIGTSYSATTNSTFISPTYVTEQYTALDVSAVFSSITAGDIFGFEIYQNNTDLYVLGLNIKYT